GSFSQEAEVSAETKMRQWSLLPAIAASTTLLTSHPYSSTATRLASFPFFSATNQSRIIPTMKNAAIDRIAGRWLPVALVGAPFCRLQSEIPCYMLRRAGQSLHWWVV